MKVPEAAIEERVRSALAYVVSVARRYPACGVPIEELIAAGNLGLVEAALRFDPSRGVKFVTYADWWIRKTMLHAIQDQAPMVRIPRYSQERRRRDAQSSQLPPYRLAVSLDQPTTSDGDRTLADGLASSDRESDPGELVWSDYARHLRRRLEELTPREREVLVLRFGFLGADPMSLREIGREIGLSRERVRQIERRALDRLRDLLAS